MPADVLVVSEVFGPTWQGEGPSLGRRAGFVRLGRCNLRCTFCDTPYTWRWEDHDPAVELSRRSIDDVLHQIDAMDVGLVVVTGGEPLLQQSHLVPLLTALRALGVEVEIETAGTIVPSAEIVDLTSRFNVSPKLHNSGNDLDRRLKPDALRALQMTGRATFKFVAVDAADLDEIAGLVEEHSLTGIWVMPEGTDAATIVSRGRALAPAVQRRGWNLTTRMHILLWGDRRGV
ncbi:MAG TPA: 7-carboxy-7-deazaguanine synthase QueE [Acidimicrobiales bacterium]|nr:7-carboxy-7-deazaguanine synthase QueE [Acidimicrobiales bacterium]